MHVKVVPGGYESSPFFGEGFLGDPLSSESSLSSMLSLLGMDGLEEEDEDAFRARFTLAS